MLLGGYIEEREFDWIVFFFRKTFIHTRFVAEGVRLVIPVGIDANPNGENSYISSAYVREIFWEFSLKVFYDFRRAT